MAARRASNGQAGKPNGALERSRKRWAPKAHASNGSMTLHVSPQLCDAIWQGLTLERKAALLNHLAES